MKEIKLVFTQKDQCVNKDSFTLYLDGVAQENVKSIDIHADNLGGDLMRGLSHEVNLDAIATYAIEHYVSVCE